MLLSAFVDSLSRTWRLSSDTQIRLVIRFGRNHRFVRLFACETLLPDLGPLPVMAHLACHDELALCKRALRPGRCGGPGPQKFPLK